jgi:hypothetical protein
MTRIALAAIVSLLAYPAQAATTCLFNGTVFGGTVSGSFTGADANADGILHTAE